MASQESLGSMDLVLLVNNGLRLSSLVLRPGVKQL
jgi:hypothetical protein